MVDFESIFTAKEKAALELLTKRGFRAYTQAKLEDVRELGTGKRRRTFRNAGRYELVLALRKVAPEEAVPEEADPEEVVPEEADPEEVVPEEADKAD